MAQFTFDKVVLPEANSLRGGQEVTISGVANPGSIVKVTISLFRAGLAPSNGEQVTADPNTGNFTITMAVPTPTNSPVDSVMITIYSWNHESISKDYDFDHTSAS